MFQEKVIDEGIFDPIFQNAKEMNGLSIKLGSKVNSDKNSSLAIKVDPSILLEYTDYLQISMPLNASGMWCQDSTSCIYDGENIKVKKINSEFSIYGIENP